MNELEEIPRGFTPMYTNGESILYVDKKGSEDAILVNERNGKIFKVNVNSAFNRGDWDELSSEDIKKIILPSKRTRKGSDAK